MVEMLSRKSFERLFFPDMISILIIKVKFLINTIQIALQKSDSEYWSLNLWVVPQHGVDLCVNPPATVCSGEERKTFSKWNLILRPDQISQRVMASLFSPSSPSNEQVISQAEADTSRVDLLTCWEWRSLKVVATLRLKSFQRRLYFWLVPMVMRVLETNFW